MAGGRREHSGRKAVPPSLNALRGNPGKRAERRVIRAAEFTGPAPAWLVPYAQEFWEEHAPLYRTFGLLTQLSSPHFIMLCDAWAEYRELREDITANGRTVENAANGRIARPEVAMLKAAFDRYKAMAPEFPIGPTSLVRFTPQSGEAEADPVEAYRAQRKSA